MKRSYWTPSHVNPEGKLNAMTICRKLPPWRILAIAWFGLLLVSAFTLFAQERATGRSSPIILLEKKDVRPPSVRLLTPKLDEGGRTVVQRDQLLVGGAVTDETGVRRADINGRVCAIRADGTFSAALDLHEGVNLITITTEDTEGNSGTMQFEAVFDSRPPTIEILSPGSRERGVSTMSPKKFSPCAGRLPTKADYRTSR